MKDESYDVPAFQFRIIYRKNEEMKGDIDLNFANQIMFSQVDGLTVNQFFEMFSTKGFILMALIDQTDIRNIYQESRYQAFFSISCNSSGMTEEEKQMEISKYIENKINTTKFTCSEGDQQLIEAAFLTFVDRFRGKDYEQISELKRNLKITPSKNKR